MYNTVANIWIMPTNLSLGVYFTVIMSYYQILFSLQSPDQNFNFAIFAITIKCVLLQNCVSKWTLMLGSSIQGQFYQIGGPWQRTISSTSTVKNKKKKLESTTRPPGGRGPGQLPAFAHWNAPFKKSKCLQTLVFVFLVPF